MHRMRQPIFEGDDALSPSRLPRSVTRAKARVDTLSTFVGVSTFLAGFATADSAGFEYDGWEEHWAVVYVVMMS
jgi:hypothetical protein